MSTTKRCFKCGRIKPLSDFYKHSQMADGHLNKCKECAKRDVNENRNKNIERCRDYDRARYARDGSRGEASPEAKNRAKAAWIRRNPEARRAHQAVSNAIRDGKLQRQPCEVCGAKKTQAHHDDYSKPLDVRWLCSMCHQDEHGRLPYTPLKD